MQSAAAPGPVSDDPWWKKPGYYLWLLAIGAIVYAYLFATSSIAQTTNKGANPGTDPVTGAPTVNVGNQVVLLLGCIMIYMVVSKIWTNGQYGLMTNANMPAWIVPTVNGVITFGLLIGLVFVSILATQFNATMTNRTADDSKGFFGSNLTLIGLILVSLAVNAGRNNWDWPASISNTFLQSSQFVLNVWFPLIMMYYFIRVGPNYWFQIVAGVSLSVTILMMCRNWWKISTQQVPMTSGYETFKQTVKDVWNSFPIAPYLKYVENADIMDVAKRVMIFALLAYVAYLMISVYKFKHQLIPCIGTDFASCFGMTGSDYSSNDTPYVNALFWTLMISVGVNALNWILQLVPIYTWINNWANGANAQASPSNFTTAERAMQLLKLLVFPFYWLLTLLLQHPVATVAAFIAFAGLGLLLYRSSFDLTAFVEGQRGTVITLFTMFVASLFVFGMYSMNSSTTGMVEGSMSYGQFIGKIGIVIAIAVCLVGLLLYFLNSHSKLVSIVSVVQYGITALIYIAGIAIAVGAARTLFSTSRKMGGSMFQVSPDSNWVINMLKLMGNLLFYLPCLMLDFVDTMKEQYGLTTRPFLILLAMEAAFILAGHLLPSAVAKAINHTGVQILSAPISMSRLTSITTYDIQFVNAHGIDLDTSEDPNPDPTPTADLKNSLTTVLLKNYNYGVSAWFYIHPQPPNTNSNYETNYINVLKFGSLGPIIQYNPKSNALMFYLYGKPIELTANVPLTVSDIPLQTWNNVIINSDKGAVDIFINNKLIYTGNLTGAPTNQVSNITIGNDEGINGEICNVVLNTAPFTKIEIEWLYKTNKVLNPPVVGVNMDPLNQGDAASYLASESVDINAPPPTPMPKYSTHGMNTFGILGVIFGAIFGWLFNDDSTMESVKGIIMGAIVFGLIGAMLGAAFSTDGTVAYVLKTVANVFVDTF